MGTVGLNFGSPTSGAGFDVSSTVAAIVSNLQNVETPWKNQLTTLESQDTAISSLGTLFSSLSNDMSQLTDFQGILAQKTGSSSDTNVLELTAATASATAGTHTVTVNSLAQTSSGYLAPIANASDTLSGSITLQVGNGTAQKIILNSSDDTLAGLAETINGSTLGITANVLTDASGSRLSLVSGTSGTNGNITVSANSLADASGNQATLTYSGGANSASGTLGTVASASDVLGGSLTLQVGSGAASTVTMAQVSAAENGSTTLAALQTYIEANAATLGVNASVVTNSNGSQSLSLTSADGASALAVTSSLTDSFLGYTSAVTGSNASLNVDGVSLSSASNTVSSLIPGVTFQLLAASSDPVQVIIGNDNTDVESTVNQFVSDYNALISAVNTQEGNTSSGTAEPLFGSPTLTLLQQQLLSGLNLENPSGYSHFHRRESERDAQRLDDHPGGQQDGGDDSDWRRAKFAECQHRLYGQRREHAFRARRRPSIRPTSASPRRVATSSGQSTLTLTSQTDGSSGALTVTSALSTNPVTLSYTDAGNYTDTTRGQRHGGRGGE